MQIFKVTLLPMSVYGFSTTVAGISLSTFVGMLVDTTPRLKGIVVNLGNLSSASRVYVPRRLKFLAEAVQSFLFVQKMSTVLGCIGFWVLLTWFDSSSSSTDPAFMTLYQGYMLFSFLVLVSASLKLSALGWSISIERDWIVCMCQSNSDLLTSKSTVL